MLLHSTVVQQQYRTEEEMRHERRKEHSIVQSARPGRAWLIAAASRLGRQASENIIFINESSVAIGYL